VADRSGEQKRVSLFADSREEDRSAFLITTSYPRKPGRTSQPHYVREKKGNKLLIVSRKSKSSRVRVGPRAKRVHDSKKTRGAESVQIFSVKQKRFRAEKGKKRKKPSREGFVDP